MRIKGGLLALGVASALAVNPGARADHGGSTEPVQGISAVGDADGVGGYLSAAASTVGQTIVHSDGAPGDPLAGLINAATHAEQLRRVAVADVTPAQWGRAADANEAVQQLLDPHAIESIDDVVFDQAALDELQAAADLPIDQHALWQAAAEIGTAIDVLRDALASGYVLTSSTQSTPLGEIVIDAGPGPCDTTYSAPAFIVIDSCGNDSYFAPAGGADGLSAVPTTIVLDTAGDDFAHESYSTPSIGAAINGGLAVFVDETGNDRWGSGYGSLIAGVGSVGGFGFMADLAGDDDYRAQGFQAPGGKFGAGQLAGMGVLVDAAGNDSYSADTFQQGSGWFGNAIGILADLDGDDQYFDVSTYAQGSGGVGGLGVLYDAAGNDRYQAFSVFEQGGAACGGIGVLLDAAGNDVYEEQAWLSQGAAATGLTATGCGDETGQGLVERALAVLSPEASDLMPGGVSGALRTLPIGAVGVLADLDGHDHYLAWSFMQGVSVGSAAGMLLDGGGNDVYSANDCAQALGAASTSPCWSAGASGPGIAVLADASGDDIYGLEVADAGQGAGYGGSVVVLADGGGTDSYSSGIVDGGGFQSRGHNGLAIDLVPVPDDPTTYDLPSPPAVPDPNDPPNLDDLPGLGAQSWTALYVWDATSEVYAYRYPDGSTHAWAYNHATGEYLVASGDDVSLVVDPSSTGATLRADFGSCTVDIAYLATGHVYGEPWGSNSSGTAAGQQCLAPHRFEGSAYYWDAS